MAAHVYWLKGGEKRHGTMAPYASADGLTWKLAHRRPAHGARGDAGGQKRPVARAFRTRRRSLQVGRRLLFIRPESHSGHRAPMFPASPGPIVPTILSKWAPTTAVSFVRTAQYLPDWKKSSNEGQQTHEGMSVWNRGNVLLGMYGMWEGGSKEFKDVHH